MNRAQFYGDGISKDNAEGQAGESAPENFGARPQGLARNRAVIRTVSMLDRAPGAQNSREIFGVTVEKGHEIPPRTNHAIEVKRLLQLMAVGESFPYSHRCNDARRAIQKETSKRFTAREIGPKQFRIWRTK